MKLAWFSSRLGGGGAERQVLRLANSNAFKVVDSRVVVARAGGAWEAELDSKVPLHALGSDRVISSRLRLLRSAHRLRTLLRRVQPDLVVCSQAREAAPLLAAVGPLRSNRRPRTVAVVQNHLRPAARKPDVMQRLETLLSTRALRRFDRVICPSEGVRRELAQLGVQATTIPNAGPLQRELAELDQTPRARQHTDLLRVVGVGRLEPQKNWHLLIDALSRLDPECPIQCTIYGDGHLEAHLHEQVRRADLSSKVAFRPFINRVLSEISASDLLVSCSEWEGFGTVLVEALSARVPFVATDCASGPAEILGDSGCGQLIPSGDAEALASVLSELALQPDQLASMRDACGQRALDFDCERIAELYLRTFRELV